MVNPGLISSHIVNPNCHGHICFCPNHNACSNQSLVLNHDMFQWGVDLSYNGPLFVSLWILYKVYSIQMLQIHCKIINLTKICMN
jgi:hypothetical protein